MFVCKRYQISNRPCCMLQLWWEALHSLYCMSLRQRSSLPGAPKALQWQVHVYNHLLISGEMEQKVYRKLENLFIWLHLYINVCILCSFSRKPVGKDFSNDDVSVQKSSHLSFDYSHNTVSFYLCLVQFCDRTLANIASKAKGGGLIVASFY